MKPEVLRKGDNGMVCIADRPNDDTFEVRCYRDIFPFRTAADTGFPDEADVPESQQRTMPYVMGSGTYWSHVMIRHPGSR